MEKNLIIHQNKNCVVSHASGISFITDFLNFLAKVVLIKFGASIYNF